MLLPALVLLAVLLLMLPLSPAARNPATDGSAYAYTARTILDGGLPYRDAWGSKFPLIFYLDALALRVGGDSYWSLWALQAVLTAAASLLLAGLLRDMGLAGGRAWAGAALLALLLCRSTWRETNTAELAALPFQIACLRAGARLLWTGERRWALLAGIAAGIALLGKQTSAGVGVLFFAAVGIGWVWQHRAHAAAWVGGMALPPGAMALTLAARGALDEALDATLRYNRYHIGNPTVGDIVRSTLASDVITGIYLPLAFFALIGVWAALRATPVDHRRALWGWIVLACAVELASVNLTAEAYPHYFITPLASFVALVIAGLDAWLRRPWMPAYRRAVRALSWAYVGLVAWVPVLLDAVLILAASEGRLIAAPRHFAVTDYVREHSAPGDTVVVWGYLSDVYMGSGRRCATAYQHSHPITLAGFSTPALVRDYVADLEANRPVLIVDTSLRDVGKVPPLDPVARVVWRAQGGTRDLPDLSPVYRFAAEHCAREVEIEKSVVFRCTY